MTMYHLKPHLWATLPDQFRRERQFQVRVSLSPHVPSFAAPLSSAQPSACFSCSDTSHRSGHHPQKFHLTIPDPNSQPNPHTWPLFRGRPALEGGEIWYNFNAGICPTPCRAERLHQCIDCGAPSHGRISHPSRARNGFGANNQPRYPPESRNAS